MSKIGVDIFMRFYIFYITSLNVVFDTFFVNLFCIKRTNENNMILTNKHGAWIIV